VRNLKLTIEYDGTKYQGWQIQGDAPTIQKTLEEAIPRIVQHPVKIIGSGRTDSGVHALGQTANFQTTSTIPPGKLIHGINAWLPPEIAVVHAEDAPPDFHARFSALDKTYRYTILNRPARSPLLKNRAWHVREPLDTPAMQQAAEHLKGRHDFRAFQSKADAASVETSVRTITRLEILRDREIVELFVTANGFLYNMVRAIAGTLVQAGLHKLAPADVKRILEYQDRSLGGPTAPPQGLCLIRVRY